MDGQYPAKIGSIRLHITPFNKDLFTRFIPPSLESIATDVSFHTIDTFPEKGFGYVSLPIIEAEKLKKKLNGSTLRGVKVRITEAKPENKRKLSTNENDGALVDTEPSLRTKAKKLKTSKNDTDNLIGHELEKGRIIKRGWQDDPAKTSKRTNKEQSKAQQASLDTKRMKFKTSVPPNAVPIESKPASGKGSKNKKARTGNKDVVVKEFSKTTKLPVRPQRSDGSASKRAVSYENGKGWLDDDGNVVESESVSKKRKHEAKVQDLSSKTPLDVFPPQAAAQTARMEKAPLLDEKSDLDNDEDATSSSESEESSVVSDEIELDEEDSDDYEDEKEPSEADSETEQSPANISSAAPDSLYVPTDLSSAKKEVHPLEALFKRPPQPALGSQRNKTSELAPLDTTFSFFNADDSAGNEDDEEENTNVAETSWTKAPQTPHTKADLEWRRTRSAAPTPDTARPGNKFHLNSDDDDSDDSDEEESDSDEDDQGIDNIKAAPNDGPKASTTSPRPQSDYPREKIFCANENHAINEDSEFRRWFYENRGELNRSWKKRRREERKLMRQRENRRLSRKVA